MPCLIFEGGCCAVFLPGWNWCWNIYQKTVRSPGEDVVCQGETRRSIMGDFVYCLNLVCLTGLTPSCRAGGWTDRQGGTAEGCQWEVHRQVTKGCREGKHKLMGFDSSSLQQEKKPSPRHSPAAWLQHPRWENEPTIFQTVLAARVSPVCC